MYLVQYERQLYRTGKSRSHTPIIVPEGLAVWGQSGVLKSAPSPEYLLSCQLVPVHAPTSSQCDEEYDPILDDPLSTSVVPGAAPLFNRNLLEITILKPASDMPPMYLWSSRWYHLGYFSDEWEHAPPVTIEPSQSFTVGIPAKLNSSQLCSYAWGKDWDEQCCRPLLFSYRNSIPGRTGGHVAGASEAYENQYMNRSKIRYRFRVGARAIRYSFLRQPTT